MTTPQDQQGHPEPPAVADGLTPAAFHASAGVEDWRALAHGASAYSRTGSFARGLALVDAIGALAEEANHHPDIDLRYPGVMVRLLSHDVLGLSRRDVDLARRISAAARELGVTADPSAVVDVDLTIDALSREAVVPFWRAVLGYAPVGDEVLRDPHGRWPLIWFEQMDEPRLERNRIHVDVWVPHDQAEARVAAALAAGGRLVRDEGPGWWTLADPEGNEADVATWQGRGD